MVEMEPSCNRLVVELSDMITISENSRGGVPTKARRDNTKQKGNVMSEVRLLVREVERDWSGTIHGSCADAAVAALSADPTTLEELETAYGRYEKRRDDRRFLCNLSPGSCDEPYDAGLVVIDLAARLVVVDSTYSLPGSKGQIRYHDGRSATNVSLPYHLADDWYFMRDSIDWSATAESRRRERVARPSIDARVVFYGRPLLEFLATETFEILAEGMTSDEESAYNSIKQIHADWLLAPREDLFGRCTRDVALERRNHLTWDLQDQSQRWSLLGEAPPGLDPSSFAFRYGGFGTHELVLYYDLVRELLWSSRERLIDLQTADSGNPNRRSLEEFLTSEVPRLEGVRDEWLDSPDWENHGRTPRSIIDRERARLPEAMSGKDAIIDPDCPCCQMLADMPGPMFWHLDGCNMDDDFAFDIYHRTREEWDEEERRREEFDRRFNAEWAERERLGVTKTGSESPGEDSVWSSSFSTEDGAELPVGVRLFGVGCHLAELMTDLRGDDETSTDPEAQAFSDQLNRDFGNLRDVLQNSEADRIGALFHPVLERFTDSLAAVASARPDLSEKCESLTSRLSEILNPGSPESDWDDDSDVPW